MPDLHRARFVAFTGREKLDKLLEEARLNAKSGPSAEEFFEGRLWALDVLADQLEFQAGHLASLGSTMVPVDFDQDSSSTSSTSDQQQRPQFASIRPSAAHAFKAKQRGSSVRGNRFMQGPEPSWVRRQRQRPPESTDDPHASEPKE